MKRLSILFLAVFIVSILAPETFAFKWYKKASEALETAKEKKMPAFLYFFHSLALRKGSPERKLWASPLLKRYENSFVATLAEVDSNVDLIKKYGVSSFPAILFFDTKGREILALRIEDETLKQTMLAVRMKRVLREIEQFELIESQIQKYKDNARMVHSYADGLRDRGQFEEAEEQYVRLFQWENLDPTILKESETSYIHMLFLQATRDFYAGRYSSCIDTMRRFKAKYPGDDATTQADFLLGMAYYEAGDQKSGEQLLKTIARDKKAGIFQEKAKQYLDRKKSKK